MLQNTIDNIAFSNKLRNTNPKLKFLFSMLSLFICVFSKSIIVLTIVAVVVIYLTLFKAKVPKRLYLKLMLPPIGFGLMYCAFMAVMSGQSEFWSFNVFGYKIPIYIEGLNIAILIVGKVISCTACTLFLALTTPMTEIFYILRSLGLPSVVVDIAMMMYRYIFVLLDELIRMQNAQETRLGYKDLKTTYKSLGILASNLFIRTWERGEKLFITMSSRGYDGELKTLGEIENPKLVYIIGILLFELFLIIVSYLTMDFKVI